ncbi:hypothetical protein GCM10009838_17860 [Catenulispora subtropica]|uniref:Uncharacterized protein n=1 Tax=Catenulispora subtropica TaxID=450798 RepID=A0ABN2R0U6_9ACTN
MQRERHDGCAGRGDRQAGCALRRLERGQAGGCDRVQDGGKPWAAQRLGLQLQVGLESSSGPESEQPLAPT